MLIGLLTIPNEKTNLQYELSSLLTMMCLGVNNWVTIKDWSTYLTLDCSVQCGVWAHP